MDKNIIEKISSRISESIETMKEIVSSGETLENIRKAAEIIVNCYKADKGRVFFAGNGGSAADAQHLAAELVSRFYIERKGLASEALNANTSLITAIGNDYSFDNIYSRQLEANAASEDVFVGLSTSGNSKNILSAIRTCRERGIKIIGMTGESGGMMNGLCDVLIKIPSSDTPRIQESHITVGHIICEIIENELFDSGGHERK